MSRVLGLDDPYLAGSEEIRAALLRNFVDADTGEVAGACQTSDGCVAFHHLLKPQEEARLMERRQSASRKTAGTLITAFSARNMC